MTQPVDTAAVRSLLRRALNDDNLRDFCYDYFRPVYDRFSSGQTKLERIQFLIEHCEQFDEFERLLALIRDINPAQVAAFEAPTNADAPAPARSRSPASSAKKPDQPPPAASPSVTPSARRPGDEGELKGSDLSKEPAGFRKPTIEFDWVTIPEGHFWMGSDGEQDPDARGVDNEAQHSVYLPAYRIARVPVTVRQFRRFISSTRYETTAETAGKGAKDLQRGLTGDAWERKEDATWEHPHGAGSYAHDNHPVTCISWHDALAFCEWANVRLPTEAEWEKAAGWDPAAQIKHIYPWGDELPDKNRCNFDMQIGDTTPVDRYPAGASAAGLLDMAGNVWEWTNSLYREYPNQADDRENPEANGERVLRGGSYFQKPKYVRCAYCNQHRPDEAVSDYGFRVCAILIGDGEPAAPPGVPTITATTAVAQG